MSASLKQVHLAAGFPGVNHTTVWSDPAAGSQIAFDSFRHVAQAAERGKFDFFFLAEGLRLRERQSFIGSPVTVAHEINRFVQDDASDGFIIGSHLVPGGLDPFVDKVVPLLQERGVFRTEYAGTTLRENLGLAPLSAVKTAQVAS
jgi:alkanesulfonate monooxygenase SsuD/methylene tetrahydromethanopterin reductase-like flavin-dependent oxidoreductase (luciferase family)